MAFGKQAEVLLKLRKGSSLSVSGKLTTSEWTDRTGAKRTSFSCIPDDVLCALPPKSEKQASASFQAPAADFNDEIPPF